MDGRLLLLGGLGLLVFGATRRAPTACVLGTIGLGIVAWGAVSIDQKYHPSGDGGRWGEDSALARAASTMVTGA
jgi:hypothetical protein